MTQYPGGTIKSQRKWNSSINLEIRVEGQTQGEIKQKEEENAQKRAEQERVEQERAELKGAEQERVEQERAEQERVEQTREKTRAKEHGWQWLAMGIVIVS
ncbi:hypothetical protein NDU88_003349 [Pleurodeles waltl]|uniref:Uncharacterized protein n=1 Tax=Pleurodeles waltl TaxID=8319 RepID=A0AAV7T6B3_PLEWA|nr:hypothetical protein NDU88_003349 [Pleurodeles waltl]